MIPAGKSESSFCLGMSAPAPAVTSSSSALNSILKGLVWPGKEVRMRRQQRNHWLLSIAEIG